MLVLHAVWAPDEKNGPAGGRLFVWAEQAPGGTGRRGRRGAVRDAARPHPFQARPEAVRDALLSLVPDLARRSAYVTWRLVSHTLRLPSSGDLPLLSPEAVPFQDMPARRLTPAALRRRATRAVASRVTALGAPDDADALGSSADVDDPRPGDATVLEAEADPEADPSANGQVEPAAPKALRGWKVRGIALEPGLAAELLTGLPRHDLLEGGGVLPGADLRFWGAVAKLAVELLARQRIVPVLEHDELGYAAGWRAVLDHPPDAARLAALARGMPPVCRAVVPDGIERQASVSAADLTADFLNAAVDALARAWLAESVPQRSWQAHGYSLPAPEAWLWSLGRGERSVRGAEFDLERLVRRLEEWRAPLASVASGSAYRTCFRLTPPADPAAERAVWDLEILLQATDDPSLLVPAALVWQERGPALSYLNRRLDRPQERLLGDLGRAARVFPPVERSLAGPHPERCALSTEDAYAFLREAAWLLEEQGFGVLVPAWWDRRGPRNALGVRMRLRPARASQPASGGATPATSAGLGAEALVEYDWRVAVGEVELTEEEFRQLAELKVPLICVRGQWVELRPDRVEQAIDFWERQRQGEAVGAAEALKLALGSEEAGGLPILGVDSEGWVTDLLGSLDGHVAAAPLPAPPDFQGSLRPYQERGVGWLTFLRTVGLGACLADDMGLGKTIQYIAFLLHQKARRGATAPALLICPTSVVANWVHEQHRFAPSLKVLAHHGPSRLAGEAFARAVAEYDLVISSYALVHRDRETLAAVEWDGVVLDEAQNVKNAATRQSQAVRSLRGGYRMALTGTPVENRLAELWSIFEFLNPGYLGSQEGFRRRFALPIERWQDAERAEQLRALVRPLILRRVKTDPTVIQDLPEKNEMKVYCSLTTEQASLYQAVVAEMLRQIDEAEGIERRGRILATLTRLKQVCNHPAHFLSDGSSLPGRSGKLERLEEMLEEVLSSGERALIFTQFAEFGALLRQALLERFGLEALFLHGGVPARRRDELVTRFQQDPHGPPLFVLSLKAGGVGLNLTRANHVFHVDRWWNPAVENQATDRAFRIGQQRNVQVHKMICAGTLEERIDELIESKRALADQVIGAGESWLTELSTAELRDLLSLRKEALVDE